MCWLHKAGGEAAHLSDLVTVLVWIRLAMTIAERNDRPFCERSMDSTGSVPLSFMISRGWSSRLQTRDRYTWMGGKVENKASEGANTFIGRDAHLRV